MKNFKRFLKYALPYKSQGVLGVSFNILYAFFTTLSYVILMPMLDVLFGETEKVYVKPIFPGWGDLSKAYLQDLLNYGVTFTNKTYGTERTLIYLIITVITVFLLKNIFGYLGKITIAFLKNNVLKDFRNEMYQKIISLPISFYSERNKGDVIARATSDIGTVNNTYLDLVIVFIREPLNIIFTLFIMFKVSWELTLIMFGFIPVSAIIISFISKKIKQQSRDIFNKSGTILGTIEETLGGLRIVKAFNAEKFFQNKYNNQSEEIRSLSNKMVARESLASPTSEFLGVASIASLLWFGGKMVLIDQVMTGGTFIGFMASAYNILTPAKTISKANNSIKIGNSAAERVVEILDTTNPLEENQTNPITLHGFEKEIRFDNVSFKYQKDYVLKNFSLTIPKGKTVAFVGESGSGKSTIANLITRFYDVNEGGIYVDGIDIKNITLASLRKQLGIVAQDSILFNDTIKNNIALGENEIDEEKVLEASKIANAHRFVKDFENGYNSPVGDRGGMLSGGQRQRIAIARAVMKNPPIMILDEATSALDTESEKVVQDALEKMMKNRTSIVIAHRLSTIQNADLIVVLSKGEIIEKGTHQQLVSLNGVYANLVSLQSLGVD